MSSIRDQFAKWREALRAFAFLAGGGAALGALLALLLPILPSGAQASSLEKLAWLPGLYRSLSVTVERPEGRSVLLLEGSGREVASFPAPGGEGSVELDSIAIGLVTATWGALLGLSGWLLWRFPGSRKVIGLSLVLGLATGLALAATWPVLPGQWAPVWLRGLGGLPGLEETVGGVVPIPGAEPSSAQLRSTGGLVAEHPASPRPWPSEARVVVTPRGRAWTCAYASLLWLAVLSWTSALQVKRESLRWPLFAFGLALLAWLAVPFLPSAVGESWMRLVSDGESADSIELGNLLLVLERTRWGHDVGLGLLLVLFAGASVVLLPIGAFVAAGHAIVRRIGVRKQRAEKAVHEKNREAIPVEGLGAEPDWLGDYEERRGTSPVADEPHPSPAKE